MKKRMKKAGSVCLTAVLVSLAMIFVLHIAGIKSFIVQSGSMEPQIHTGSLCFVNTHSAYERIKQGDIIAFSPEPGYFVTHRVLTVTEQGLETKGDANEVSDGVAATRENFCGKTLFSIPGLGYLCQFIRVKVFRVQ